MEPDGRGSVVAFLVPLSGVGSIPSVKLKTLAGLIKPVLFKFTFLGFSQVLAFAQWESKNSKTI
jgi:hypothetical protein